MEFYHRVEHLPGVERAGIVAGPLLVSETAGKPDADVATVVQTIASEDGRAGYSVAGSRISAGRMPRPDRPFEATGQPDPGVTAPLAGRQPFHHVPHAADVQRVLGQ